MPLLHALLESYNQLISSTPLQNKARRRPRTLRGLTLCACSQYASSFCAKASCATNMSLPQPYGQQCGTYSGTGVSLGRGLHGRTLQRLKQNSDPTSPSARPAIFGHTEWRPTLLHFDFRFSKVTIASTAASQPSTLYKRSLHITSIYFHCLLHCPCHLPCDFPPLCHWSKQSINPKPTLTHH